MNYESVFITQDRSGQNGSSLYVITENWVIRCSGNTAPIGGQQRRATTFARRRDIRFIDVHGLSGPTPAVGRTPRDAGHDGHNISTVLDLRGTNIPHNEPPEWQAHNGVTWAFAVQEVTDALAAINTPLGNFGRFSREAGNNFHAD